MHKKQLIDLKRYKTSARVILQHSKMLCFHLKEDGFYVCIKFLSYKLQCSCGCSVHFSLSYFPFVSFSYIVCNHTLTSSISTDNESIFLKDMELKKTQHIVVSPCYYGDSGGRLDVVMVENEAVLESILLLSEWTILTLFARALFSVRIYYSKKQKYLFQKSKIHQAGTEGCNNADMEAKSFAYCTISKFISSRNWNWKR